MGNIGLGVWNTLNGNNLPLTFSLDPVVVNSDSDLTEATFKTVQGLEESEAYLGTVDQIGQAKRYTAEQFPAVDPPNALSSPVGIILEGVTISG